MVRFSNSDVSCLATEIDELDLDSNHNSPKNHQNDKKSTKNKNKRRNKAFCNLQ